MDRRRVVCGFMSLVSSCGREERFTFRLFGEESFDRTLVAWTPGALVPIVIHDSDHPFMLGPLVAYVEEHGALVLPEGITGD